MSDSNIKYVNFKYIILAPQKFWSRSTTALNDYNHNSYITKTYERIQVKGIIIFTFIMHFLQL